MVMVAVTIGILVAIQTLITAVAAVGLVTTVTVEVGLVVTEVEVVMVIKRKNKYNAKKIEIDGHIFSSIMESKRYVLLKEWQNDGLISDLVLQPVFVLQDKFVCNGKNYRATKYIGDFEYKLNGCTIVEDVKGVLTATFKLKFKWLLNLQKYRHIDFRIVTNKELTCPPWGKKN